MNLQVQTSGLGLVVLAGLCILRYNFELQSWVYAQDLLEQPGTQQASLYPGVLSTVLAVAILYNRGF